MHVRTGLRRAATAAALLLPAAVVTAPGVARADDDLGTITVDRAMLIPGHEENLVVEGTYSCERSVRQPGVFFAAQNRRTGVVQFGSAYQKKRFVLRCDGETHDWVGITPNVQDTSSRYRVGDKVTAAAIIDDVGQTPRQRVGSAQKVLGVSKL
ncbi:MULTISPECIES: hypothetical protein [Streptomycetaceae]|uniref:Uncharacterized protein n=1 Tax=Streptantibioticus cattleyicolor (strain ATCC 35852 / DSM 46488 / JCM 4925 / NBRC 14057 / NRRL 8057) TaxID=1003195 RepID=F8JRP7_STREN|nr:MULTISPECIES: hypothetical protein [Streptomycetaceae]AEW97936.1 hypothetical protein SCATT_55650 [Streptantibioticus cattleyicolor NRRL 8057 = DSM 46488]MYS62341.1 hypothetical protein [Streptomyces sp. SID5468]CCB78252.1 exported protein of unknown function [Streptantibioticus cattleyicolor NRRL 8057 = DSM 46488]